VEKGLHQGGDQEPDGHSDRVPLWRWDNLLKGQPSLQNSTNQAFYGRVTRRKAHDSPLGVSKKHRMDTHTMRNKIFWSDETKIELFVLNAKCHIWRKPGSIFQQQGLGE
jgi:hypothetical protein